MAAVANYQQEIMKQNVSQFATFMCAYQECSPEIRSIVDGMLQILTDPDSTEDERDHASDAVIEAFFPSLSVDCLTSFSDRMQLPVFREANERLDEQERSFAERLKALMETKGITQQELAEKTGVTQPAISNMLRRECRPQQKTVLRLAEGLGVAPEDLWKPL